MHQKRVTAELHDSYFRLMTIKHAIPKIEWAIEWAIEVFYNSVRQEVSELEIRRIGEKVVEKATTQQKGPLGPPMEFGEPVGDKMR